MKETHVTKENFLTRTNYLNHSSLNLLIGSLFLTLPTFFVMLLIVLGENFDFLWAVPLLGIFGWWVVIPSTYIIPLSSKERVAVDILSMGFMAMLLLCVILISFKRPSLTDRLEFQSSETVKQDSSPFDFKEREETYLEQVRLLRQEIEREEQK